MTSAVKYRHDISHEGPVWLAASRRDVVDSGTTSHNTPVPTRKPLATVIGFAVPPVIGGVGR
ncbi:MAG TPA: hypothetical protein VGL05_00120, partial [Kribbella sp.]